LSLRRKLAEQRNNAFSVLSNINIQKDSINSKNSYYLYTVILPQNDGGKKRDALMNVLRDKYKIGVVVANQPTYCSNSFIKKQKLPIADNLGQRILCLCIHPAMTKETNDYIISSFISEFKKIFKY
jgi:perosamine synthetase